MPGSSNLDLSKAIVLAGEPPWSSILVFDFKLIISFNGIVACAHETSIYLASIYWSYKNFDPDYSLLKSPFFSFDS